MSTSEKSLGEIAATAAGWTWTAMPSSQRAEFQRAAEAVQAHLAKQREEDILRAHKKFPTR